MQDITKKRLIDAGWNPNRQIDISEMEKGYADIGLKMPDNVKEFLVSFGMIKVNYIQTTPHFSVEEVHVFDPYVSLGDYRNANYIQEELEEYYGFTDKVYPIGEAYRSNMILLMTNENTFYAYTDGCFCKLGENVEIMLDCLIGECFLPEDIEYIG